jgi:hypothetical protein
MKPQEIVNQFRGQYVSGFYTKKDGKRRRFHGQLRTDERSSNCVLYFDKYKKTVPTDEFIFRRISNTE